ncbi:MULTISPECIES: RNA polymerase factor sigma-54 [unclassified Sulfuricurvum]|uniref:RNA polymerase factor sigma-54 n=1 Tax=unclassified Sulfuricurvum TaxID=2632390 RepID=UPI000299963A|nr:MULTISPECIES: RNA polymerase factor sigma-54 [unclassified Sulfuricurvum]AFV97782.1 RNA polymerase factor sigma-54 [Candidatus Sulfuricurvum sp. RIFRC-1]OHD83480.1 MAG: RNA polymerase factor sigma-54 [Sulfuricurvum sp. RIFCSPLOWO2_02_43_6]OHD89827.1 MAG: RNA polymerase factor sigma-54 [Sulfuricurvum sp. RIFCSPLOWO2_12_FULL_43_24]HBM36414.1 RNA polymerase sigma-54 factor [Sulfuricurvum sp.]
MLRVKTSVELKNKLSNTLRNWLPILQSSLSDLGEAMAPFVEGNPLIDVKSGYEESFEARIPKKIQFGYVQNSHSEAIEALTIQHKSLYEVLEEQIDSSLFPTPISRLIATHIIENLDEGGYYEGESEVFCAQNALTMEQFEKIRLRFIHVEPVGIGARNVSESFLFQLDSSSISDSGYTLASDMINHLDELGRYRKEPFFDEAMRVIGSFKNPPAIDYMEDSMQVIPDLMIYTDPEEGIEVKLNDQYYPSISIDAAYGVDHTFVRDKLKEAKSLVDALEMRKATLYKVGLMIVEYQYDFFTGGAIKPLTLKTLADEFGHNPSTISRAIANKYIACNRGIYPMKEFFTTAIDEDVSNAAIKEYVSELVKNESHKKPLSDMKLLEMIQEKFKITMVRRTIAKYRKQLNIAGSSERKQLYLLGR